jgi:hypothetical protein
MKSKKTELKFTVLNAAEIMEGDDGGYFLELVQEMGKEGEICIRVIEDHFVISPRVLSVKQAERAFEKDQTEQARTMLKDGADPFSVWQMFHICAGCIDDLLREEKITADTDWREKGEAEEEARHKAALSADLGALKQTLDDTRKKLYAAREEYEVAKAHQSAAKEADAEASV